MKLSVAFAEDDDGFIPSADAWGRPQLPSIGMRIIAELEGGTRVAGRPVIDGFRAVGAVVDEELVALPLFKSTVKLAAIKRWQELETW
jgi:hypothetical protein